MFQSDLLRYSLYLTESRHVNWREKFLFQNWVWILCLVFRSVIVIYSLSNYWLIYLELLFIDHWPVVQSKRNSKQAAPIGLLLVENICFNYLITVCTIKILPISKIFTPSIMIVPSAGSTRRKRHTPMDDFPEPVLPTIPIFSFDFILQVIPFRTKGRFFRYRIYK